MSEPTGSSEPRPLRGWKEIATHLGTSTRSAQRYADDLGLPVHRRGTKGAPVIAFPAELDDWLRRQSPALLETGQSDDPVVGDAPLQQEPVPGRGRWVRTVRVLAVVFVVGAIGAWAAWRTLLPEVSPPVLLRSNPDVVTLGVRVGESQSPAFLNVRSGGASMVGFKSGEKLWVVPTLDGDRLRVTLYDAPEGTPGREPVAKASLTKSQASDIRPVSFQFDYATIHLWWASAAPRRFGE